MNECTRALSYAHVHALYHLSLLMEVRREPVGIGSLLLLYRITGIELKLLESGTSAFTPCGLSLAQELFLLTGNTISDAPWKLTLSSIPTAHLLPHGSGATTPQGRVLPSQVLVHTSSSLQVLRVPVVRGLVLPTQIQQDGHTGGTQRGGQHSLVTRKPPWSRTKVSCA